MFAGGLVVATVATFSPELGEKGRLVTSDGRCLLGIIIRFDNVDHLRLVHANYGQTDQLDLHGILLPLPPEDGHVLGEGGRHQEGVRTSTNTDHSVSASNHHDPFVMIGFLTIVTNQIPVTESNSNLHLD